MDREEKKIRNTNLLLNDPIFNNGVKRQKKRAGERNSNWNFTINSNSNYGKMTDQDKKLFKNFMNFVFDEDRILDYITDKESPSNSRKNIDKVKIDFYYENSANNLLHAHGILRIKHHGFIRLRLNDIRQLARKIFGKNIHIDAPVNSDTNTSWENYMKKSGVAGKITI
jgi:hypothetical protein